MADLISWPIRTENGKSVPLAGLADAVSGSRIHFPAQGDADFCLGKWTATGSIWFMLESRQDPVATRHVFLWRVLKFMLGAAMLSGVALGIGVLGYHHIAGFTWMDSLLDASMILGGMGPVGDLPDDGAKFFASAYALFSGLVFISVTGIVLTPMAHRLLHHFHLDNDDLDPS